MAEALLTIYATSELAVQHHFSIAIEALSEGGGYLEGHYRQGRVCRFQAHVTMSYH
jgi:hypothetical protein